MSDDLTGSPQGDFPYAPERPVAGPPPAFIPPTPVPARPPGPEGWPWYYALITFFGGFAASLVVVGVLQLIWMGLAGENGKQITNDANFTLFASAVNEFVFIFSAWFVAARSGSVSLRDFGLVYRKPGPTLLKIAAIMGGYLVLLSVYSSLVHLTPDTSPDKLGAGTGAAHMFFFAVLVAVLAPIAEEFFFRGMIFRALVNGTGVAIAAIVSGLLFGALHIDSLSHDRLMQVIPLALFGMLLAVLYAWSGTLFANIAVHATNNTLAVIAFASKNNSNFGIWLAVVLWVGMMTFCFLGHRLTDRGEPGGPGQISGNDAGSVTYALPQ